MAARDKRIDAYIAKSAPFARPILEHLREVVHSASPEIEEDIKWGMPHFMYKGMLCGMAAFKQHAVFGFWKGSLIVDPKHNRSVDAMGQFGCITKKSELPSKRELVGYVKKAMELNEEGVKVPRKTARKTNGKLVVPDALLLALRKNKKALATFESFPPSKRRDYVEWIAGAKGADTRKRRVTTAVQWLSQGKSRNWKYESS
jgi:uncharacterized protein YdeI (YjbR/CyaY-like superfamily)